MKPDKNNPEVDTNSLFQQMTNQISALNEQVNSKDEIIKSKDVEIERLKQILLNFQRARFGQHSEKSKYVTADDQGQPSLFNEAELEQNDKAPEPTPEICAALVKEHTRKKKRTRAEICKNLPREEVVYDLPVALRTDKNGRPYKFVTKKFVRTEMIIIPEQVKLVDIYTNVYVSQEVDEATGKKRFVEAKVTGSVMKNSMASPSSVADVMTKKYVEGMPLYRQEQQWKRLGVNIPRNTLANWVITPTQNWFVPIFEAMKAALLKEKVIHADETPVQVLKEPDKPATSKSEMWVYASAIRGHHPIRLFDYHDSRKGSCAKDFLEGFHGVVITDGYSGYNKLEGVTRAGCWAHCRRYWYEAMPLGATAENCKSVTGFNFCNRLFELEKEYAHMSDSDRQAARMEKSKPVLDEFWRWLDSFVPEKGSPLSKPVVFSLNQKPFLSVFLDHGEIEISNNQVENAIRPFVVGRKGWLFSDTPKGANASAIVYSLVESAKANDLNPYSYLLRLLTELPMYDGQPAQQDIDKLMPWSDYIQKHCALP